MPLKSGLPSGVREARNVLVWLPAGMAANVRPRLTVSAIRSQFRIGATLRPADLTLLEAARQQDRWPRSVRPDAPGRLPLLHLEPAGDAVHLMADGHRPHARNLSRRRDFRIDFHLGAGETAQ